MDLESLLKKTLDLSLKGRTLEDVQANNLEKEVEHFNNVYHGENVKESDKTYKAIPKFYFQLPKENELALKLREDARAAFLQNRSKKLLDNKELNELWVLLEKYQSPLNYSDEQFINYIDYLKVKSLTSEKCSEYLTATLFAKLQEGDPYGRVSLTTLFNYVMRKVWQEQTRLGLSLYDITGNGYLREADLENYILELIPSLPQLNGLEISFHRFYVCTAVRKFFFFLDPLRSGRVRVQDILTCSFLDELLELRDEDVPKDAQKENWFSAPSALHVYGQYLNLDRDHNGMLSKDELAGYGTGTLTSAFLDRVFQECLTYEGEMDYKTYLDLVLALENRKEPQSLQYLFRILDVNSQGFLDTFCFNFFYRAIQEEMKAHGQEPVNFEDVKDELFDMVKPMDPTKITLKDLLNCGQGDVLINILIDLNGFWSYENREAMAGETSDDPAEPQI